MNNTETTTTETTYTCPETGVTINANFLAGESRQPGWRGLPVRRESAWCGSRTRSTWLLEGE